MALKLLLATLSLSMLALAGCSGGADATINIHDSTFDPKTLTVEAGQQVHVENHDSVPHTVTADSGAAFNSGNVAGGADVHFNAPSAKGSYPFHCAIHLSMKGTLVVE